MAPNLDSPVQTQMAIAVLNRPVTNEYHDIKKSEGRPSGRRRVFVQTDSGCVLGIELDRGDNAHTVKRKLQLALHVPTDESSLTFGDLVLKNDLSAVRKDSPLLLTRNFMHRSSSTPCLSPTGKDLQHRDRSGPIEIIGCPRHHSITKQLVKSVVKAIQNVVDPIPIHNGLGGAYYFRNCKGERIAIVKPTDEEPFAPNNPKGFIGKALGQPGLKKSVRVGETGFREVAAYLLDYDHFANVPPTALVKITHSVFNVNEGVTCNISKPQNRKPKPISKIASFQQFIPHDFDAGDHGTSVFPVAAVHRIGILDVRIFNTDRHAGNLLVRKLKDGAAKFGGQVELIPIDHGLCLPETLDDPYFEWIHWPQASIPFSDEELEYIAKLDPVRDSDMLRLELPMIREACIRVLVLCTTFLKEAAAFGLCLSDIGEMMSRHFTVREEEPSELEVLCIETRKLLCDVEVFHQETHLVEEFQFDIDCEETDDLSMPKTPPGYLFGIRGGISRNPLSKLDESLEEIDEEQEEDNQDGEAEEANALQALCASKLSISPKGKTSLQGWSRSLKERLPTSASFVSLADMGEEEWGAFLEKFQELLHGAFCGRRCKRAGRRHSLGSSCQF
ncbi:phosphatidylinositol 4-kinase gamma 7 [Dendrobium catenatum]|uniref:1-phosphatidylinositol 4-kinase n=1 Tax=Dendrobium catenatum TaxID=906689 RepID=A0A2I0VLH8_9ASPA|nr:phosphatidylinositol 4-kinase gamma 7 [Dendrobium catenatum]XP_028556777.1 phosphatidylinositol 4-kinase gamma 7 [Dendrobium catenatum]PKU64233.1 putative phosphatidylinositol 4-kinase type 2-beta [Dendrobium catenatum]